MVNDCSTDNSGKIIDKFANRYDNFKAIHLATNSGGCGKPRNVGMENSKAPYIMFLDPDDYYLEDACETLYNEITSEKADIAFGKYFLNYENFKQKIKIPFDNIDKLKITNIQEKSSLMKIPPSVWAKIYKRDFIKNNDIKFYEEFPGEDLVFITHSFLKANGIIFLNKEILSYRIRKNANKSMSFNRNNKFIFGLIESYKHVCSICKANNAQDILGVILENHLSVWLEHLILSDLTTKERKDALISSSLLFKECMEINIIISQKHLKPIFSDITNDNYENAVILINSLVELIRNREFMESQIRDLNSMIEVRDFQIKKISKKVENNQQIFDDKNRLLKDKLKNKEAQVAKLQTFKGYLNYKSKNIYNRLKKSVRSKKIKI